MSGWVDQRTVAVARDEARYAKHPPFHPSEAYPEWPGAPVSTEDNPGFRAVRRALLALGLDAAAAGTPGWNPLGALVPRGGTVVVKPNLVTHANHAAVFGVTDTDCLVTHGSVIRALVDYAARALGGAGKVIVADCPLQGADWDGLMAVTGLPAIRDDAAARFPGVEFELRDLRLAKAKVWRGQVVARVVDEGGRARYTEVDLGARSLLMPLMRPGYAFGVTHYARARMRPAHTPERNCYLLPKDILAADLFVNVPKMKIHQKAGITCALKNLVGINGHKDYLPHFRFGSPRQGGDEYPDGGWPWDLVSALAHADWEREGGAVKRGLLLARAALQKAFLVTGLLTRDQVFQAGGAWHGNDTLWRTVLDINRALLYWDRARGGVHEDAAPRAYLTVLDGLVAGHRDGPLAPHPYPAGAVLAARNPAAMDAAAAAFMGLDPARIPQVRHAFEGGALPLTSFRLEDVELLGDLSARSLEALRLGDDHHALEPSVGWRGHVEATAADLQAPPLERSNA
ncbi:MAG: DUF362 domain-containing protein [Anaeromyxobacteraceae bacterium]